MTKPSISFIIPYYKTGIPLLRRAIQSIMQISCADIDCEIWIIDDGTPSEEAKSYVCSLSNTCIHYFRQTNSGLGGARNTGIGLATKNYIQFIDSDDAIFPQTERVILKLLSKKQPEILSFDFKKTKKLRLKEHKHIGTKIIYQGNGSDYILTHSLHGAAWGYIFKKSLLDSLRFTPHIYHEDEEFTVQLFAKANNVIVTNLPVYSYTQRSTSIVHNKNKKIITKRFADLLEIILRLKNKSKTLPDLQRKALNKRAEELSMAMLFNLLRDSYNKTFLQNRLKEMRQNNLYPLPRRPYSLPYRLVRRATLHPIITTITFRLFRLRYLLS